MAATFGSDLAYLHDTDLAMIQSKMSEEISKWLGKWVITYKWGMLGL